MAEQVHTNGSHEEEEGDVHADLGPEVTILNSTDARTQESLKQADATIRRLTTADMKPVETFRSMDVGSTFPFTTRLGEGCRRLLSGVCQVGGCFSNVPASRLLVRICRKHT